MSLKVLLKGFARNSWEETYGKQVNRRSGKGKVGIQGLGERVAHYLGFSAPDKHDVPYPSSARNAPVFEKSAAAVNSTVWWEETNDMKNQRLGERFANFLGFSGPDGRGLPLA